MTSKSSQKMDFGKTIAALGTLEKVFHKVRNPSAALTEAYGEAKHLVERAVACASGGSLTPLEMDQAKTAAAEAVAKAWDILHSEDNVRVLASIRSRIGRLGNDPYFRVRKTYHGGFRSAWADLLAQISRAERWNRNQGDLHQLLRKIDREVNVAYDLFYGIHRKGDLSPVLAFGPELGAKLTRFDFTLESLCDQACHGLSPMRAQLEAMRFSDEEIERVVETMAELSGQGPKKSPASVKTPAPTNATPNPPTEVPEALALGGSLHSGNGHDAASTFQPVQTPAPPETLPEEQPEEAEPAETIVALPTDAPVLPLSSEDETRRERNTRGGNGKNAHRPKAEERLGGKKKSAKRKAKKPSSRNKTPLEEAIEDEE